MIEDVYEPLERYQAEFREKFARLTEEKFASMVAEAGVDEAVNAAQVKEIDRLSGALEQARSGRSFWYGMIIFLVVVIVAAILAAVLTYETVHFGIAVIVAALALVGGLLLILGVIMPKCRKLDEKIAELSEALEQKTAQAWKYMQPLNELFDWGMTAALIEKTVPRIQFDPFFTCQRLYELKKCFDWDERFNQDKSVLFSHSGLINGNPFVFGRFLTMRWDVKTYTGSRTVSWSERQRGADGKYHTVQRVETLVASVDKPIPVFEEKKRLFYGNEAAGQLSFSRQPSDFSGQDGCLVRWRKKRHLKRLEKFSRNLTDDSNFTLMGNHEFEVLFNAVDRDDEVGFRLLFTPLAQQQMLKLMNDTTVGYGDDFSFCKRKRLNIIQAGHLDSANLNDDPEQFHDYSLQRMREAFLRFNKNFFHDIYFALAPLLTIPLYQQYRTAKTIYETSGGGRSCFWEHEALVNYMGEKHFEDPACITRNIIKTRELGTLPDGTVQVEVTAYGYRGVPRIDAVPVMAQNGRTYRVDVPWTEYLPVQRTSVITVAECRSDNGQQKHFNDLYKNWLAAGCTPVYRRMLAAIIK